METIKVNMNPNPLDVQTIHASQNDGEARQWEFELHNNGELIDTSEITEQMFFKAYKGGTEQLLPENTSTPTTSPFLGDIRYPQGLLSDQEFTYRQSPTEEDGLAKITDIKGNTLVWNQLVQNGNFASTSNFIVIGATDFTVSGNVASFSVLTNDDRLQQNMPLTKGHKYLICMDVLNSSPNTMRIFWGQPVLVFSPSVSWQKVQAIFDTSSLATSGTYALGLRLMGTIASGTSATIQTKNWNCFDLTQMGLDITDPSDFTSLFPLSYYSYNQGSLLSFNGNGIKTVGKNLNPWTGVDYIASTSRTVFLKKGDYVLSTDNGNSFEGSTQIYFCLADSNGNNITSGGITSGYLSLNDSGTFYYGGYGRNNIPFTLNFDALVSLGFNNQRPANINEIQLEFGSTPSDYEPYTSSTTNLPVSTYFPTGMKSAGTVYDELTPTKAVTRVGSVDLGTLTYVKEAPSSGHPDWPLFWASVPNALGRYGTYGSTQICAKYSNRSTSAWQDKTIGFGAASTNINIADTAFADYTVDQVKQALSGVMLYYQLATPTETSFTTASLVTENAEIPLSNEDGTLIGKCTEQLSENPGFIDAKIKLSDSDGECYSNKIQLHVERKPS